MTDEKTVSPPKVAEPDYSKMTVGDMLTAHNEMVAIAQAIGMTGETPRGAFKSDRDGATSCQQLFRRIEAYQNSPGAPADIEKRRAAIEEQLAQKKAYAAQKRAAADKKKQKSKSTATDDKQQESEMTTKTKRAKFSGKRKAARKVAAKKRNGAARVKFDEGAKI